MKATYIIIVICCLVGVLTSLEPPTEAFIIRMSLLGSSSDEDFDGALAFKEQVETESDGTISVELYPSGQFCSSERECLDLLQAGSLQIFMFTTGGFGNVFGPAQALDLPYMYADDVIAECVLSGTIIEDLQSAIDDTGLSIRLMTTSNTGGWRNFATTESLIKVPEDIHGRRIRTITAPMQQEFVSQMNGNATPVAWSEVYTALATGVVDGTKNGIVDIVSMRLHEQIRFYTLDKHTYMGGLWFFSEASWQELSIENQTIVGQGFERLKAVAGESIKRREIESYKTFTDSGGVIYEPTLSQKKMFQEAAYGMRAWYSKTYGNEWLLKVDSKVESCMASGG